MRRHAHSVAKRKYEPPVVAGRVPPHDLDTEAVVIEACFRGSDTRAEVMEVVQAEHFYSESNRLIYEAICDIDRDNKEVSTVSVASWLRDRERLTPIGGAAYVAQLCDATPSVHKVRDHAERVKGKWRLRQLIAACQRIVAEGYGDVGSIHEFIDGAEQAIYDISHQADTPSSEHVGKLVAALFTKMDSAARSGEKTTGLQTGYERVDRRTSGMHGGDLIIVAGRPGMGKTTWVMNVAVNAASPKYNGDEIVSNGTGVAVFSLEMSREQLVMRMVASEGRINLQRVRVSALQPQDWERATYAANFLSALPLWIDDTPAISLIVLRAKVRRIQAMAHRFGTSLGLIVIDYLQLMSGRPDADSREQEVSELSRGLKALAKELGVPIVALSQLNRQAETRSAKDKRPQLSDLRECLAGDQIVPDAVTGELVTIRDIAAGRPMVVYGLSDDMRTVAAQVAMAWSTGRKLVYLLLTASGRRVRATANHPFLTINGWTRLDELRPGDRIATPREVPQHHTVRNVHTADELRLLGYLISDGHCGKNRSVGYVKGDPALVQDVRRIALERFGITAKDHKCNGDAEQIELTVEPHGPGCNPLIEWLKLLGIHGQLGHEKYVPASVFRCSNDMLGVFLGALWAGDGSVVHRKAGGWVLKFTSTSARLLDDVQWILTRLGIVSSRSGAERNSKSTIDIATISIGEADAILRFAKMVEVPGIKGERLLLAVAQARNSGRNARLDRLPIAITEEVFQAKRAAGMSWKDLGYRCQGRQMCRTDLARVADVLGRDDLARLASDDILWDEIDSVTEDGEDETFDMRVPGLGNFVVGNVFAHNSGAIEQDADTIIFIYRDEYYFPETTPHKGIAELICAKLRNGPPGTDLVRFDGSCTRFDNLASGDYPETED